MKPLVGDATPISCAIAVEILHLDQRLVVADVVDFPHCLLAVQCQQQSLHHISDVDDPLA
jgi:hypothetical protein